MSAAVAAPVMPQVMAMKLTSPFEKAPVSLSIIGRIDSVTASFLSPFFSCPYSIASVRVKTVTSCAKVKLYKARPMTRRVMFDPKKIKIRYETIMQA